MDEMIERCARALAARHYAERFAKAKDDPHVQMNVDGNWHIFAEDARTVIEAMREPTKEMYDAGCKVCDECCREGAQANNIFNAMIDAALAAPPAEG